MDVHTRVQQHVGAHHAADCTRSANHGYRGLRIRADLQRRGTDAAQQVEEHEAHRPHRVLHVVAEYPQEPHVADDVQPAAVHEHRRQHRRPARRVAQFAPAVRAQLNLRARRHATQQLAGYQPELADRARQRRIRAKTLHEHPHEDIDGDDAECRIGNQHLRIVISDREHVRFPVADWPTLTHPEREHPCKART